MNHGQEEAELCKLYNYIVTKHLVGMQHKRLLMSHIIGDEAVFISDVDSSDWLRHIAGQE